MNNICIYAEVIALARFFLGLLLSPQILNIQLPSPEQWHCLQPGLLQGRGKSCMEGGLIGAWGCVPDRFSCSPYTTLEDEEAGGLGQAGLSI